MKKLSTCFFLIVFSLSAFATIHTVSNIDSSAQFSTIQSACDASQSRDSIYVSASPYTYDAFTIDNKKLAVFGPGWAPFVGGTATVGYCTFNGTGASGSELHGLIILNNSFIGESIIVNTEGINNLIIFRNKIRGFAPFKGTADNYLIEGNWFDGYGAGIFPNGSYTLSKSIIKNNIFIECGIAGLNGDSTIVDHNLFYGRPYQVFGGTNNAFFSNNIIQLDCYGVSFCTFNNNITYNVSNDAPWNGNNNTDAGGNLAGINPQMVDEASVDADVNNPLLNFTIVSGPANNTGSDRKDMGLLFDKGKVTNWNYCRAAHLPYITDFNITDQNISANSYIHFNVKAKSN